MPSFRYAAAPLTPLGCVRRDPTATRSAGPPPQFPGRSPQGVSSTLETRVSGCLGERVAWAMWGARSGRAAAGRRVPGRRLCSGRGWLLGAKSGHHAVIGARGRPSMLESEPASARFDGVRGAPGVDGADQGRVLRRRLVCAPRVRTLPCTVCGSAQMRDCSRCGCGCLMGAMLIQFFHWRREAPAAWLAW